MTTLKERLHSPNFHTPPTREFNTNGLKVPQLIHAIEVTSYQIVGSLVVRTRDMSATIRYLDHLATTVTLLLRTSTSRQREDSVASADLIRINHSTRRIFSDTRFRIRL
ncbi:hypothetical protein TNCV_2207251 [Trichonephila clavipes]|uniref:Uncharacterized protein n=1 Tax=Trichonephila clavipes TaxID=2585209 RepID=A0A8X6S1T4_TRICX|nr:hypothetical protein TNCV_2207251 [Trichonephila clavipes]